MTGASRGIGRGIALELGSAGYTVYCLGRSSRKDDNDRPPADRRSVADGMDLTVESTAEAVTANGGNGRAVCCDVSVDEEIDRVIEMIEVEEGRLDVLVPSAFTTLPGVPLRGNFWEEGQGKAMWDAVNGIGLRGTYLICHAAAPLMIRTAKLVPNDTPLMCLISSFGGKSYTFNVAYGIGKAAIDRLATDASYQLLPFGVATVSLYPGLVKTEANLQMVEEGTWEEASGGLDLSVGETPAFSGKAVVALTSMNGDQLKEKSGGVEVVAELAKELGFTDVDGNIPPSIRSLKYLLPNFVFPMVEKDSGKAVPGWIKDNIPDVLLPWSVFSGPPPES